jgi:V/A-type H+-transporting ATPase subunit C
VISLSYDTEYAYAVARIQVIENKLLNKDSLYRMVDARTIDEAVKMLQESGYSFKSSSNNDPYEIEESLKLEYKRLYDLMAEIAPEPEVFKIFRLKNDYHNLKVIIKSEYKGYAQDELLLDTSTIPYSELKLMVRDRKLDDMSEEMRNAVLDCVETFNKTSDPQVIDLILDRAAAIEAINIARASKKRFIIELNKIIIDLTNISSFLRVRLMGKTGDFLGNVLLPGGKVNQDLLLENLEKGINGLMEVLASTEYEKLLISSAESYEKGIMSTYEKLSDNYILDFVKKHKYSVFDVEPLVGYLFAKENEIRNVRIIMTGKINNIPGEIIKERLRETYV